MNCQRMSTIVCCVIYCSTFVVILHYFMTIVSFFHSFILFEENVWVRVVQHLCKLEAFGGKAVVALPCQIKRRDCIGHVLIRILKRLVFWMI